MAPNDLLLLRQVLPTILSLLAFLCISQPAACLGGETGSFNLLEEWADTSASSSHRQDLCERYDQFSAGEIELRDALSGLSLSALVANNDFFNYSNTDGINPEDPGLMAELMDAVAERANFTWRNSFAVYEYSFTSMLNMTWTDFLFRSIEEFDIVVDWYLQSVERMELGAAFIVPWFDSGLILVDQIDPPEPSEINYTNWAKPFEPAVWGLIFITVVLSALVYQLVEHLNGEREDRSLFQWFSDNLYLSSLNSTQNFEYAPNSVAGRLFGISMGIWALVVTATYTANLASLFVEDQKSALKVDSIEQAIVLGIPICVWAHTAHEEFLRKKYKKVIVVQREGELEMLNSLRHGECGLALVAKDNWRTLEMRREYNPDCDLEWTGRTVKSMHGGFAVNGDAGDLCSSFIRDVINVHMIEFINGGGLDVAWAKHRTNLQDLDCNGAEGSSVGVGLRRHLQSTSQLLPGRSLSNRRLKAGGKSSAAAAVGSGTSGKASLSVDQMIGTFVLHWAVMAFAVVLSFIVSYYDKWEKEYLAKKELVRDCHVNRTHGPIIGVPPPVNTYVIRQAREEELGTRQDALENEGEEFPSQATFHRTTSSKSLIKPHRRSIVQVSNSTRSLISSQGDSTDGENDDEAAECHNRKKLQHTVSSPESVDERMSVLDDKMEALLSLVKQQNSYIQKQDEYIQEMRKYAWLTGILFVAFVIVAMVRK